MRLFLADAAFGGAAFVSGEEEADDGTKMPPTTSEPAVAKPVSDTKVEDVATSEGLSILQKVLFLAVITGCVAIYLRLNKVKQEDTQGYEKSLA